MKGYLGGVFFKEDFIDKWFQDPNWQNQSLSALEGLICFDDYCQKELSGNDKNYHSLRSQKMIAFMSLNSGLDPSLEMLLNSLENFSVVDDDESEVLKNFSGFKNSFRIIAKQNSIKKAGNLLEVDGDFEVFFDINPSPEYKEALEHYLRKHGKYPDSYTQLENIYQIMCEKIHDHMVKLPICRDYFAMLSIINYFSGYFSTLKKHRKIPVLPAFEINHDKGCPPLFPHLPIQTVCREHLKFNLHQVFKKFLDLPEIEIFLTQLLKDILTWVQEIIRSLGRKIALAI